MRRRTLVVLATWMAICMAGLASLNAADSFFQRMSPFRFMRSRNAVEPASTHEQLQPAAEGLNRRGMHAPMDPEQRQHQWAGTNGGPLAERTEAGRPPTLEELRAHLLSRGIDPDQLDARFTRMQEARANGRRTGQTEQVNSAPDPEQLRSELESQGMDPAAIQARLAEMHETRANNGRFDRQEQGDAGLERSELQSRLVRQGVTPEALNVRLGKMYGVDQSDRTVSDRSVGAGVGRVRSRR